MKGLTSKFGRLAALAFVLATAGPVSAQTATEARTVSSVLYNGAQSWTYFTAGTGWGAPGCTAATYVQIPTSVPGRKEMLAIVLMAKAQGKRVWFSGTCSSHPDYFDAHYVVLVD